MEVQRLPVAGSDPIVLQWAVNGTTDIEGPDATLKGELKFENKVLTVTITSEEGEDFKLFGVSVDLRKAVFVSDRLAARNANNPNYKVKYDPQISMAGILMLPVELTGERAKIVGAEGTGELSFEVTEDKPILIDRTGITLSEAQLALTGVWKLPLFNLLTVEIHDPVIKFGNDKTGRWVEFRVKIIIPELKNAEFDFAGENYVKISQERKPSRAIHVEMVGVITIRDTINITKDGSWNIRELQLSVNTVEQKYTGQAKIQAGDPKQIYDVKVEVTPTQFTFELQAGEETGMQLWGMTLRLKSLVFVSDRNTEDQWLWDPELTLQGSLELPQDLTGHEILIDISGDNQIVVNEDGISVSGGKLSLPGEQTFLVLGLLEVRTLNAEITFNSEKKEAIIQGQFTMPSLNDATLDLTVDEQNPAKSRYIKNPPESRWHARVRPERPDHGAKDCMLAKPGRWKMSRSTPSAPIPVRAAWWARPR